MASIVQKQRVQRKVEMTGSVAKPWHPRIWDGMGVRSWLGMLARYGFRISPSRIPMAVVITGISPINSAMAMGQQLRALRRGVDVVVATPGRALDHLERGTLRLDGLRDLD